MASPHRLLGDLPSLVGMGGASEAYVLRPSEPRSGRRRIERVRPLARRTRRPPLGLCATASVLGDSLSAGFHLASSLGTAARFLSPGRCSWFLDRREAGASPDLAHALARDGSLWVQPLARPMARVVPSALGRIAFALEVAVSLQRQVERWCLDTPDVPSLVCVWIGHNDLDWAEANGAVVPDRLESDEISRRADAFERALCLALDTLVAHALARTRRTAIVVLGLVNLRSFFRAREIAEGQRTVSVTRFPYLERGYGYFPSMHPRHRAGMVSLGDAFDERIAASVARYARRLQGSRGVRIAHSDAFSRIPIERARFLNAWDAWHPSAWGRASLAEVGLGAVRAGAEWLGIAPPG